MHVICTLSLNNIRVILSNKLGLSFEQNVFIFFFLFLFLVCPSFLAFCLLFFEEDYLMGECSDMSGKFLFFFVSHPYSTPHTTYHIYIRYNTIFNKHISYYLSLIKYTYTHTHTHTHIHIYTFQIKSLKI